MSKRIGFNSTRLQTIDPGAYSKLPKSQLYQPGRSPLSFYYTYDGVLRGTDGNVTYAYVKGDYNPNRKRYAYSWEDVTHRVGKNKNKKKD